MSTGEVQPRRRRDKKKKKAQLEALAKEGWEEGTALYRTDQRDEDEEETVEPMRDSSSGEEEESSDESNANQSMKYKIIFFILLLLLGGLATVVLVENNGNNELNNEVGEIEKTVGVITSDPIIGLSSFQSIETHEESLLVEDDSMLKESSFEEITEEPSFLESISVLLNEFIEGDSQGIIDQRTNHIIEETNGDDETKIPLTSTTFEVEITPPTDINENDNNFVEIQREFDEFEEIIEDEMKSEVDEIIEISDSKFETQIEKPPKNPVDQVASSDQSQWESNYPKEINLESMTIEMKSDDDEESSFSFSEDDNQNVDQDHFEKIPEILEVEESIENDIDFAQGEDVKSNGNSIQDEIIDELL